MNLIEQDTAFDYTPITRKKVNIITKREPNLAGFVIRYIKIRFNLSSHIIGSHFGFSRNTVSNWTNGKAKANFDDIVMICEYFKLDVSKAIREARVLQKCYKKRVK